jgi:hypothetical protein
LKKKKPITRNIPFFKVPHKQNKKNTPCKVLSSYIRKFGVGICKSYPQGGGTSIPKMRGHHKTHDEVYHEPKHTQLMGQRLSWTLTYAKSQGIGGGWLFHTYSSRVGKTKHPQLSIRSLPLLRDSF